MSNENKFPSQLAERFQIRMPDGLRDQIRDAAEANNRSMNAEILSRLSRSTLDKDEEVQELESAVSILRAEQNRLVKVAESAEAEVARLTSVLDHKSSMIELLQRVSEIYKGFAHAQILNIKALTGLILSQGDVMDNNLRDIAKLYLSSSEKQIREHERREADEVRRASNRAKG